MESGKDEVRRLLAELEWTRMQEEISSYQRFVKDYQPPLQSNRKLYWWEVEQTNTQYKKDQLGYYYFNQNKQQSTQRPDEFLPSQAEPLEEIPVVTPRCEDRFEPNNHEAMSSVEEMEKLIRSVLSEEEVEQIFNSLCSPPSPSPTQEEQLEFEDILSALVCEPVEAPIMIEFIEAEEIKASTAIIVQNEVSMQPHQPEKDIYILESEEKTPLPLIDQQLQPCLQEPQQQEEDVYVLEFEEKEPFTLGLLIEQRYRQYLLKHQVLWSLHFPILFADVTLCFDPGGLLLITAYFVFLAKLLSTFIFDQG